MIAQVRQGRTNYLLDPHKGRNAGSKVNEYRAVRDVFYTVHSQLRNALLADQQKKKMLVETAAAAGGAILLGGIVYAIL